MLSEERERREKEESKQVSDEWRWCDIYLLLFMATQIVFLT